MSGPPPPASPTDKISSSSSETAGKKDTDNVDMSRDQEHELEMLARRLSSGMEKHDQHDQDDLDTRMSRIRSHVSRRSSHFAHAEDGGPLNPFLEWDKDPELNPHEKAFKVHKWLKTMLAVRSRDPERYPRRSAGVSFRGMNVYGFGSAADYQADVGNTLLKGFTAIKGLFGIGQKTRIDILRNFEGLVKSGEMLIVLGRPGRLVFFFFFFFFFFLFFCFR